MKPKKKFGLDDIYYYKYHYNNEYGIGKYTDKFKELNKGKNLKSRKQSFRNKCAKYSIDNNNILIKNVLINNVFNKKKLLKKW